MWRFIDLPKALWTLTHSALYFARGDSFKDPYEGQLPDSVMATIKAANEDASVSDYSADAVLFTPNGPLKGHGPIREFFRALIKEFEQPGTTFSMQLQSIDGDFAYALWSAETADNVYEMATDTHVVEAARSLRNRLRDTSSRSDNLGCPTSGR